MKLDLHTHLSEFTIRRLAGAQNYRRGLEYFHEARVKSVTEKNGGITASVQGSERYRIQIKIDKNSLELEYSCSCPVGMEGHFCRHLVAAGLQWLSDHTGAGAKKAGKKKAEPLTVPEWLARQKKTVLIDLIMEHADDDDDFWNWLEMNTALMEDGSIDMDKLLRCLDNAILIDDFVDYHEVYDYFCRVENALEILERLLERGYGREVMTLTEHAFSDIEQAIPSMDDSGGYMQDIMSEIRDIHYRACRRANPDKKELAHRLFEWELHSEYDTFTGAADTYAEVLDREGLKEYRRLAEKAWNGVKALKPGEKSQLDSYRSRLRHIMETLARREGNVDVLVEIKKRDLSRASCFLDIARLYLGAGRHDDALAWAERGMRAFEKEPDMQLVAFLAEVYFKKGRHEKGLTLIWDAFLKNPCIERYHLLRSYAKRARQWVQWQQKAMGVIRESLARMRASVDRTRGPMRLYNTQDHSLLVQICLEEDDLDKAWEEAMRGGCSEGLWMQLAVRRENDHPEDSLSILQQRIGPLINRKNNDAYKEALGVLAKIKELMARLGRGHEFEDYVRTLNSEHNRKRNFLKLLEKKKWI